jgi:tetratricopeptide (TPR) repeat protein
LSARKIKGSKSSFYGTEEILSFSERIAEFARERQYWIIGAAAVVLLALALVWGVNTYSQSKERQAREEYTEVIAQWPTGDLDKFEGWEKLSGDLQKFIEEHRGTQPSLNAQLDLAQAYFWMKKYENSLNTANQLLQQAPSTSALRPLARYHLALTYEETEQFDHAISQWDALAKQGVDGLEREVNWHLARLYSNRAEYGKAIEYYEKALKTSSGYPDPPLIQEQLAAAKSKSGAAESSSPNPPQNKDQG